MELPRIVVNLKAYREALGKGALRIAEAARRVEEETGVKIAVAPQYVDLVRVSDKGILTLAQHVDPVKPGAHTGHVTVESIKEAGASGSLLNHSERRMLLEDIATAIGLLRDAGLISIVCASNPDTARAVSSLHPDAVAVEPPELIGTGISVSKAKPEIVRGATEAVEVPLYVGAGITSGEDVATALQLGAYGVLLASAVAKSPDPYSKLLELARGVLDALG